MNETFDRFAIIKQLAWGMTNVYIVFDPNHPATLSSKSYRLIFSIIPSTANDLTANLRSLPTSTTPSLSRCMKVVCLTANPTNSCVTWKVAHSMISYAMALFLLTT